MPTSTIKDVELVSVGTWAAATGVTQVTLADLTSMLAAHADGFVDHAPVKLGHASSLNDGIGDGEPAYGWVVPTGIRKNAAGRDTLVGDLVGMPSQLAAIAPAAYRRRSVEIAWEVKAQGGKTYRAALVGVALLGAEAPAVKGLADVLALYTQAPLEERRDYIEVVEDLGVSAVRVLAHLRAAGATEAELTELAVAGGMRDTVNLPPAVEVPDNDDPQTSTTPPQEGRTMALTDDKIRKALGLEATADVDAEVNRLIAERETAAPPAVVAPGATAPAAVAPPAPGTPAAPAAPATPAAATAPGQPAPELVGAGAETATLSAGTLAELQREAEWARNRRRQEALDGAVRAGRIAPAERGALTSELAAGTDPATAVTGWAAAIERDEAGTVTLLSQLAPRFAVSTLGADDAPNASTADAAFDTFESQVFGLDRTPQA